MPADIPPIALDDSHILRLRHYSSGLLMATFIQEANLDEFYIPPQEINMNTPALRNLYTALRAKFEPKEASRGDHS